MRRDRLPELAAEIEHELRLLADLVEALRQTASAMPESGAARQVYIESAALKLHNFYAGCERIFERIASDLNGGLSPGDEWHRRLLNSMSLQIPGVRPAVLSVAICRDLQELLTFCYVVRNIYGYELDGGRVAALAQRAREVFAAFRPEVEKFCVFLREVAG